MLLDRVLFGSAPVVSCVRTVIYPVLGLVRSFDVLFVCSRITHCWYGTSV